MVRPVKLPFLPSFLCPPQYVCPCGWQAVKKSPEVGFHIEENCFILLPPKRLFYRL